MLAQAQWVVFLVLAMLLAVCHALPTQFVEETSIQKRFSTGTHRIKFIIYTLGIVAQWDLTASNPPTIDGPANPVIVDHHVDPYGTHWVAWSLNGVSGQTTLDMTIGIAFAVGPGSRQSAYSYNIWDKSTYTYGAGDPIPFGNDGKDLTLLVDGVDTTYWLYNHV